MAAHFVASCAASMTVFTAVAGLQGVLLAVFGPRLFARVSPILQSCLVASIFLALFALPTISGAVVGTATGGHELAINWDAIRASERLVDVEVASRPWILYTPPLWFLGVYEWVLGTRDPIVLALARTAALAFGLAVTVTVAVYPLAYRRLMATVVEQSAGFGRVGRSAAMAKVLAMAIGRHPEVRAVSQFFLTTIARVERHRFVLAIAVGAALAWSLPGWLAVAHAPPLTPTLALLALPFSTMVLVLTGLRVAASLPSDLRAAWMFDVTPPSLARVRLAMTRTLFAIGVLPVLGVFAVLYWRLWGTEVAVVHTCVALAVGVLLIQALLWRFEGMPCSQPWSPERANLRQWWPAYVAGFSFFTFVIPSLELVFLSRPVGRVMFIAWLAGMTALLRAISVKQRPRDVDTSVNILASALQTGRESGGRSFADDDEAGLGATERTARGWRSMFGEHEEIAVSWSERVRAFGREVARLPGQLPRDTRFALRRLAKAPAFTTFSIVTLALSIGATTAVYSVIYSMAWRDLGIRDAGRVVAVSQWTSRGRRLANLSWPDYQDLRGTQTTLGAISGWSGFLTSLAANGSTTLISGEGVSGGGFDVVHVPMLLGRSITADDDRPDAPPVLVLSEPVWRKQFGGDPHVVGRVAKLGTQPFDVIGVAPASFLGLTTRAFSFDRPAVWVPLAAVPPMLRVLGYPLDFTNRRQTWITAIGRLGDQHPLDDASREIATIGRRLDASAPLVSTAATTRSAAMENRRNWSSAPIGEALAVPDPGLGWLIVAIPAFVLLIACTNLANLVLSRGASRRHEFAIRQALGNSRGGVIRELLVEHGLIAVAGAGAGLLIAHSLLVWLSVTVQESFGYLPQYRIAPHLEPAVVAAAVMAAVLALVISGLMPALQLTRGGVKAVIAAEASMASPRWRGRANLIAIQVAVSVGLLLVAALFVRELITSARQDEKPGLERVALVNVSFGLQQRTETQARYVLDRVLDELKTAPGVQAATVSSFLSRDPVSAPIRMETTAPDKPFADVVDQHHLRSLVEATPGLWRTLGLSMRSGRAFDETDVAGARVAVIDETAARQLFGTIDASGRTLLMRDAYQSASRREVETWAVVGVAANSLLTDPRGSDGAIYVPFAQRYVSDVAILARASTGDVSSVVGAIRTALRHADPELAINLAGRADVVSRWGASIGLGLVARIATALAFLAVGLAMAGLYGVLSHVVTRRTRELGVRAALGAEPAHIARMVLLDGLRPVAEGLLIGLAASWVIRLILQTQFTKPISGFDLVAFIIAMVPLMAAALVACYLPARRAARVNPNVALKEL
jgi:predicted permease